jgi:hypothetical protein
LFESTISAELKSRDDATVMTIRVRATIRATGTANIHPSIGSFHPASPELGVVHRPDILYTAKHNAPSAISGYAPLSITFALLSR